MMDLFDRRLTWRFLRATGLGFLVLFWLALIVEPSVFMGAFDRENLASTLGRVLVSTEMAFALAAPLGIMLTLLELKRAGLLPLFMAAGLTPARLRRLLLVFFAGAVVGSAILYSATVQASRSAKTGTDFHLDRDDGVYLWKLGAGPAGGFEAILFRPDDLDVTRARAHRSSPGGGLTLSDEQTLSGALIARDRFQPAPAARFFAFPSFADLVRLRSSPAMAVSALNRILLAGVLLLLVAYITLLTPMAWQWVSIPALMLIVPAVALGMTFCAIGLARADAAAWLVEALWLTALFGAVAWLHARFNRRGLRLA